MLLVTAVAMITVTLVATEEHPSPADGALLVPWTVPAALVTLALALAERAVAAFLARGRPRALALAAAAGVLGFAAIETGGFARFLP